MKTHQQTECIKLTEILYKKLVSENMATHPSITFTIIIYQLPSCLMLYDVNSLN